MGKYLPASHTIGLHPGMMHAEISEETAVRRGSKSLGGKTGSIRSQLYAG